MSRRRTLTRVVAALLVLTTAGCSQTVAPEPAKPPQRWPEMLNEIHFVWTAEPDIDLLTRPAVVVRTYFESKILAAYGGNLDYLYPGFDHAVDPNQSVGDPKSTLSLWPETENPTTRPIVGANGNHLLRVTQDDRNVTAVICHWDWMGARQQPSGQYQSGTARSGPVGVSVMRLDLLAPPDPADDTLPPQKGPSRFATTDVFGDWRVVGVLSARGSEDFGPEWPDYTADLNACGTVAPETEERRHYLTHGEHPRSDFPTPPPTPGWPAESQ